MTDRDDKPEKVACDIGLLAEILRPFANTLYARYGYPVYIVGSALTAPNFYECRDVDVVCVLPDDVFEQRFGGDWHAVHGFGAVGGRWAAEVGKLTQCYQNINMDLKVQSESWAKARHADKPRRRIDGAEGL